jgi:hypothetical protein
MIFNHITINMDLSVYMLSHEDVYADKSGSIDHDTANWFQSSLPGPGLRRDRYSGPFILPQWFFRRDSQISFSVAVAFAVQGNGSRQIPFIGFYGKTGESCSEIICQ